GRPHRSRARVRPTPLVAAAANSRADRPPHVSRRPVAHHRAEASRPRPTAAPRPPRSPGSEPPAAAQGLADARPEQGPIWPARAELEGGLADHDGGVVVGADRVLGAIFDLAARPPRHAALDRVEGRAAASGDHVAKALALATHVDVIVPGEQEIHA